MAFGPDVHDASGFTSVPPALYSYAEHYALEQYQKSFSPSFVHSPVPGVQPHLTGFPGGMEPYPTYPPMPWDHQRGATSPTPLFPSLQATLPPTPTHPPLSFPQMAPRRLFSDGRLGRANPTRREYQHACGSFNDPLEQVPTSALHRPLHHGGNLRDPHDTGKKNELDITQIEAGLDTRTTVMIKNIPNKMTDKDLLNFIARVCPRRIDFMYLRMDFQNGEILQYSCIFGS